jgi:hypothetical protein
MAKEDARKAVNARVDAHDQQDRALADRLGRIDPGAGIQNKIPLRVKSEVVSPNERRETIVKKISDGNF